MRKDRASTGCPLQHRPMPSLPTVGASGMGMDCNVTLDFVDLRAVIEALGLFAGATWDCDTEARLGSPTRSST